MKYLQDMAWTIYACVWIVFWGGQRLFHINWRVKLIPLQKYTEKGPSLQAQRKISPDLVCHCPVHLCPWKREARKQVIEHHQENHISIHIFRNKWYSMVQPINCFEESIFSFFQMRFTGLFKHLIIPRHIWFPVPYAPGNYQNKYLWVDTKGEKEGLILGQSFPRQLELKLKSHSETLQVNWSL